MKHFTLKIKQLFAAMMLFACIPASAQFKATVEQYANTNYSTVAAEFKLTEIATALSTDTATLVAALDAWYNYDEESGAEKPADMFFLKSGEELVADYSTNARGGFWLTRDYKVGSHGVDAVFYEDILWDNEDNADYFSINLGQFPDSLKAGATLTPTFVMQHGDKQVTFDITYIVNPLPTMPEAELEIAKLEIVGETEVTATQYPRSGYTPDVVYVNLAGVAEKLGVEEELFPTMLPNQMYQAYVEPTYGYKVDSLIAITVNDGWARAAMDKVSGDTINEVCSANYGNLGESLPAFYTNGWSYNASNDTLQCNFGQKPGVLQADNTYYTYVYIVYGSKAFRIKYSLIVEAAPVQDPDDMVEAGRESIIIEQYPNSDYALSYFSINLDSISELVGTPGDQLTFQATDANGGFTAMGTTNLSDGFWMTKGGIVCSWGTNAFFYVEPTTTGVYSEFATAQMPGVAVAGDEGKALMYLVGTTKYYTLDITLKIIEPEKVEQNFESVATRNYTVQAIDATYTWSEIANSASIPFADIYNLIGTTEPVLYALNVDSVAAQTGEKYTKTYTMGEKPGFWLDQEGHKADWGSAPWGITGLNSTADNFIIQCIQMDGYGVVGDVYTGQFFLVNEENQKMLTINLTYQIVETIVQAEIVGEEWINLPVSMDDASVDYDLTKVATAFGLESVSALFEGYYVKGLKADGTYTEGLDAIESGVILNTSGAADTYGDIGVGFSEDYKQIWTYSNVDIEAPFKAEATFCFEIDSKRYIIHATLLDPESYAAGIEGISADKKDGKIYNLQGQEVAAPAKGIYIMNGKKFLVK